MPKILYHENFYVNPQDVDAEWLILHGDELRHAAQVVRKKKSSRFAAIDGCGNWYECEVEKVDKRQLKARIICSRHQVGEPKIHLTLAQSVLKGRRFDWLVEKGTEIGVSAFIPLICERSVAMAEHKVERWRRIALVAMKQCGRSVWPSISPPISFKKTLKNLKDCDLKWIAHENDGIEPQNLKVLNRKLDRDSGGQSVALLIGPEGGFTNQEVTNAMSHGFSPINLGMRRLRSETAGIVATTLVMGFLGELGG
jgi:16S rRNA (uracil1498-N3)-methyltransferase